MNLNYIAPVNPLGYGVAGFNIARALNSAGVEVALFPIGQMQVEEQYREVIRRMQVNAGFYDVNAPSLRIWHQNELAEHVGRGGHIGFPFFELDIFNAREKHHLKQLDQIFVASGWAQKVVWESIHGIPVHVVPLGVDREIFNENVPRESLEVDHTIFVNIGKWEIRKGHDILLSAFNKAFSPRDKVVLKMLCENPFIGPDNDRWANDYLGSPMGRNIRLIKRLTTHESVARLMMASDCGVFPSRAEGWNLELLEMMSMGKHVITTNVTAHTEFCNNENSYLINVAGTEEARDGIFFNGQGNWAYLDSDFEEQLILNMRNVHQKKQSGDLGRNDSGIQTAKSLTWDNTAAKIIQYTGIANYDR